MKNRGAFHSYHLALAARKDRLLELTPGAEQREAAFQRVRLVKQAVPSWLEAYDQVIREVEQKESAK